MLSPKGRTLDTQGTYKVNICQRNIAGIFCEHTSQVLQNALALDMIQVLDGC